MRPVRIVTAFAFAAAVAVTGCAAHTTVQPSAPSPTRPAANPSTPPVPTPTLPLGRVGRLGAVQAVGTGTAFAAGKGAILATRDGGRTWGRVWRGTQELDEVDFVSASTGWAVGDGVLLGTVDGGRSWHRLGRPAAGPLRQVHFASRAEGWGVAGGNDRWVEGPVPQGATRLVHTLDGGRTWATLASPAPPQSVCFTAPGDGWLASGTRVWRSVDGGRSWGARPSFTLPLTTFTYSPSAVLQCARPGAAWALFDSGEGAAGSHPYVVFATGDGGGHWRGVLGVYGGPGVPAGPGSYPGPFSLIDPGSAFLLGPTPAADSTGAVLADQGGSRLSRLPRIPRATLSTEGPMAVSFASATSGWVVGGSVDGRGVILATVDGGRSWHTQLHA